MQKKPYKRGNELIGQLREHLELCLHSHPRGHGGISVKELQEYSGLSIKGVSGREVWFMAVVTLLVELWKAEKIKTEPNSVNTERWKPHHKVWLAAAKSHEPTQKSIVHDGYVDEGENGMLDAALEAIHQVAADHTQRKRTRR